MPGIYNLAAGLTLMFLKVHVSTLKKDGCMFKKSFNVTYVLEHD